MISNSDNHFYLVDSGVIIINTIILQEFRSSLVVRIENFSFSAAFSNTVHSRMLQRCNFDLFENERKSYRNQKTQDSDNEEICFSEVYIVQQLKPNSSAVRN